MNQKVNEVYAPLFLNQEARYFILMGGRGAGRSTAVSQFATANLVGPDYFRCAIMRYVLSDIRNSIYQDVFDRIEESEVLESVNVREHMLTFEYGKNRINGIGFKKSSGDQKSKLKSLAGYNNIIIEEGDEVHEDDFMQLDDSIRTTKTRIRIILNLNPPHKNHWIIRRFFNLEQSDVEGFYIPRLKAGRERDTVFIHTSYKDNIQNISESTRVNYESYLETNPEHYHCMIRGFVSEGVRGRIFKNWKTSRPGVFEELPFPSFYGLDFGFTNHPAALIEEKMHNTKLWTKELIYQPGMTNGMLARRFEELGISKDAPIYADSAEPKSIQELRDLGWNVLPADKGADSIKAGVDVLLEMEVFYTEDSVNIGKEVQEYKWALDKNKEPINKPIDDFNHAMDAIRYGVTTHRNEKFIGFV
jgi:phage terminase large subunit